MGVFRGKLTDDERAERLFSPYLDGQVSAEERAFLERYLAGHPQARDKFETLKRAVQLTRTLPPVKAPRSFVLPRSMARKSSLSLRLYPAMRLATVAAMALFVFALVGDLATSARLASEPEALSVSLAIEATAPLATPGALEAAQPVAPTATVEIAPAAGAAMSTETPPAQSDASQPPAESTPAPTPEAARALKTATEAPAEPTMEPEASVAQASNAAPMDALRTVVIALAGLTILLSATTFILRIRAR